MEPKPKGLCIATRCASVEDFVARFHPFCDETSIFVTTNITRPVGIESQFAILLADKTPVLRGWCIVFDAWTDGNNPYNRPGMRLGVHRLTVSSKTVMEQLLATRRAALAEGKPLVQQTQPIKIEKDRAGTVIGMPAYREPAAPRPPAKAITVKIPAITTQPRTPTKPSISVPRTITGAVPVVVARTESRKISIPTIKQPEHKQPEKPAPAAAAAAPASVAPIVFLPPAPAPAPEVLAAPPPTAPAPPVVAVAPAPAASDAPDLLLDGPTERMSAPPVHVMGLGLAEVAAPTPVIDAPPLPARALAIGTSPPAAPSKLAEGSAGFVKPALAETRTPGSDFVLPANPLMDLSDESLKGFVEWMFQDATHDPPSTAAPSPEPSAPEPSAPEPARPPVAALPVALPASVPATDWRIVMVLVLVAITLAFGVSYGVASWVQARAAAAHHS